MAKFNFKRLLGIASPTLVTSSKGPFTGGPTSPATVVGTGTTTNGADVKIEVNDQPDKGESTGRQTGAFGQLFAGLNTGFTFPGFPGELTHSFATYRIIRGNPTVTIARLASNAPVKAAELLLTKTNRGDDRMLQYIKDNIGPYWNTILGQAVRAKDFGFQPNEVVYASRNGMYFIDKIKALIPDATAPLVDNATGAFLGCVNYQTILPPEKTLWFTYDMEADNYNGNSIYNNDMRKLIIPAWRGTLGKLGQYISKAAGIIPMIEYPEGTSEDSNGTKTDNFLIAQAVLQQLGSGNGVTMPNKLAKWAENAINRGVDISQLKCWVISFLETKGNHAAEMTDTMRMLDTYITRLLLTPERAIMEGQFGTKAEAGVHTELVFMAAEDFLSETVVPAIQQGPVNSLLRAQYGPDAVNAITVGTAPLVDEKKAYIQEILKEVLSNSANVRLLLKVVNMDTAMDTCSLPKAEETLANDDLLDYLEKSSAVAQTGGYNHPGDVQPTPKNGPIAMSLKSAIASLRRRLILNGEKR